MHDGQDEHHHTRQKVDGDRAGPGGNKVAGIFQNGACRRKRHEAPFSHSRPRQDFVGSLGQRLGLRAHRSLHRLHHLVLAVDEVGRCPVRHRRDKADRQIVCRTTDRRRDRGLRERGHDARQRHGLGRELVGAGSDIARRRDQPAHRLKPLLALFEKIGHLFARPVDIAFQRFHLGRHLGEQLHHAAGAGGAGQRTGLALDTGKLGEPFTGALDIRQKALRGNRVLVRAVKIGRIGFHGFGKVLFDGG